MEQARTSTSGAIHDEFLDRRTQVFPLTVEQYHRMIETGILMEGEPFELLDGQVIRKDRSAAGEDTMTVGKEHSYSLGALNKINPKLLQLGCHMRIQQPISLPPDSEPEPDAAIVRGDIDAYRAAHPTAKDVLCVIEVADASLRRDRNTKLRIYADGGIARYVLVNLPDRVVEVYTEPAAKGKGRYTHSITLGPKDAIDFPASRSRIVSVPVRKLLP